LVLHDYQKNFLNRLAPNPRPFGSWFVVSY
jgi:hypothetical protein